MAEQSCRKRARDEGTCPICRGYYTDPMTLDCGHNFCSDCIDRIRGFSIKRIGCPVCRETVQTKKLRPNSQLANVAEVVQDLSNLVKHRGACTVEKAEEEFAKDQINRALEILMKKRRNILEYKEQSEKLSQHYLKQMDEERKKNSAAFSQLHSFLHELEKNHVAKTEEVKKWVLKRRDEHLAVLSGDLSKFDGFIKEVEEAQQQSESELLQNSEDILDWCRKQKSCEKGLGIPIALKWRIHDIRDITPFFVDIMDHFTESLVVGLQLQEANVSLDPDTAHPSLVLSEDSKSVRWNNQYQDLLHNPKGFTQQIYVLGREQFTGGRHFWEVAVSDEEEWSVGVAAKSVNRECNDKNMIWKVGMWNGEYRISLPPDDVPLSPRKELKKIRVTLNYPGRQMGFFDADTGSLIALYPDLPFDGETLLPCFNVSRRGHLTLCPSATDTRDSVN